jgi:hypothetical protein
LTSLKFEGNSWKTSRFIAIKNFTQSFLFLVSEIIFSYFIDLSIFLPEGHIVGDFTSFSMNMYRLIGQIPMFLTFFLTLNHLRKGKEILELIDWFLKFHAELAKAFGVTKFFRRYFWILFICLVAVRIFSMSFLLKWNILVTLSYLFKLCCDLFLVMFLFVFIILVNYLNFALENFNRGLMGTLQPKCQDDLENLVELYLKIFESIERFYKIFYLEVALILLHFISKAVLIVRESSTEMMVITVPGS